MSHPIDAHTRATLSSLTTPAKPVRRADLTVDPAVLVSLFEAQVRSRQLDFTARWLQSEGAGFYTISSAGHEGNAMIAAALRPTDPALLHYRSGAFYLARAAQVPGTNGVRDVLLGLLAAQADPASGGRHKVFGNAELAVIPQTSTIASHLPRAIGIAMAIDQAASLGLTTRWPRDAIVICSFGDAAINHSTAAGAFNAASQAAYTGSPLPLLFVCEDNGLGISVRTPPGWVQHALSRWTPVRYEHVDGNDAVSLIHVSSGLADWVRDARRPAILHMSAVRFMGHAGSDAEVAYRHPKEITADYDLDPIIGTARALVAHSLMTGTDLLKLYDEIGAEIREQAVALRPSARLSSRAEIIRPLDISDPALARRYAATAPDAAARARAFGDQLPESESGLTLAQSINACLTDLMATHDDLLVFGEDVGRKGGVYGVTRGLHKRFGSPRVRDTLLDEQTILGTALGAAISGFLPVPEIQYLAYVHNAEDQIRGEAATLRFFSNDAYRNGMVIRIAGLAYQKGFGGHFHNDNSVAVFRDIPGIVLAVPASPADAPGMLRACAAMARADGRVCIYLEPIALYHMRDLYQAGDGGWMARYVPPQDWDTDHTRAGGARVYGDGDDLAIVTFGNGLMMSLRAARRLERRGIRCRVVDLRWLAPLPLADLLRHASATGRVLIADETRASGGVSESVLAALIDHEFGGVVRRVTSADSFVPLGTAAQHVLLTEHAIEQAALATANAQAL